MIVGRNLLLKMALSTFLIDLSGGRFWTCQLSAAAEIKAATGRENSVSLR